MTLLRCVLVNMLNNTKCCEAELSNTDKNVNVFLLPSSVYRKGREYGKLWKKKQNQNKTKKPNHPCSITVIYVFTSNIAFCVGQLARKFIRNNLKRWQNNHQLWQRRCFDT